MVFKNLFPFSRGSEPHVTNNLFRLLLIASFLLEGAGYLAFPYIALQLREQFGLSSKAIGGILSAAIWMRPLFAISGGFLSERISPVLIFSIANIFEGGGFIALAFFHEPFIGAIAILLGSIGFSIWHPNIFAITHKLSPSSDYLSQRIALLNSTMNMGALLGSFFASVLAYFSLSLLFITAGMIFLVLIFFLFPILNHPIIAELPVRNKKNIQEKISAPFSWVNLTTILWSLITLSYWMSYNQFNSYFSLFMKDWLNSSAWVGVAFGIVAIVVSLMSLLISRVAYLQQNLISISILACSGFAFAWLALSQSQWGMVVVCIYLILLGVSESVMLILLVGVWGNFNLQRPSLMQSINFSLRNIGMGLGTLLGGYIYHPPIAGIRNSIINWSIFNFLLLVLTVFLLCLVKKRNGLFLNH